MKTTMKITGILITLAMLVAIIGAFSLTASAAELSTTTIDGETYYQIGTADDLYTFASMVNGGQTSINGILTADIVVNEGTMTAESTGARVWTPIGNPAKFYDGSFDGNNHTVSGLFGNYSSNGVGLFGFVDSNGKVQNVGILNSYFRSSAHYVGGVVGYNIGIVENCYNAGTVSGVNSIGGVVGYNIGIVENCYNTGTVSAIGYYFGGVVGCNSYNATVTNSYFLKTDLVNKDLFGIGSDNNTTNPGYAVEKDANAFTSGEVAYLLNGSKFVADEGETLIWGQSIGTDASPVFKTDNNTIYTANCNYTKFGNSSTVDPSTHDPAITDAKYYNASGVCLVCGSQATAKLTNGTAITFYLNLADAVTAAQSASGSTLTLLDNVTMSNAVDITSGDLTIDLNGKTWTASQSQTVFVQETANVKITDNSSGGDGKLICTTNIVTIDLSGNASLEIERGTVENSGYVETVTVADSAKLTVSGGKVISNGSQSIMTYGAVVISGNTTLEGSRWDIYYHKGSIDLSAHNNPAGLVINIHPNVTVNPENFKLPAGFVFLDEYLNTPVTSLTAGKEYTVGVCPHSYDENGFCSYVDIHGKVCGAYEPATLNANGYYEISNAGKLYWFADKVNNDNANYGSANAILTKDIVVNEGVMSASTTGARVWTPIGNYAMPFAGIFNGNGKTISGLYINNFDVSGVGLFGRVGTGGKVENVGIINFYFYVDDNAAGVAGFNEGTVTNCYSKGYVSGERVVGGVVASNANGSVNNCYNMANVRGNKYNVGGVVGSNFGTVQNCYNMGNISTNTYYVGGIAGENFGSVLHCYNIGNVSGEEYVGGLVGANRSSVQFGYNVGNVSGEEYVGSLLGFNDIGYGAHISDCYYLGTEETDSLELTSFKTAEQFASGEVAYLLGTHAWGQKLGKDGDPYPVYLTETNTVYIYYGCDNKNYYTNDATLNDNIIHLYGSESKYKLNDAGNGIVDWCATCGEIFGTVTISAPGGTYCGSEFTASIIKSGTLENTDVSLVYSTENGMAPVNAGTYTVSFTALGLTARAELTVAPREIIIIWGNTFFMYNGEYQAPTATAAGLLPGDTCTVIVDGAGKWGNNSYTAVATGVSNPNYKIPAYNNTCNFFIDVDGSKEIGKVVENVVDAIIPDDFTENVTNAVSDAISGIFDNLLSALYEAFAKLFN